MSWTAIPGLSASAGLLMMGAGALAGGRYPRLADLVVKGGVVLLCTAVAFVVVAALILGG